MNVQQANYSSLQDDTIFNDKDFNEKHTFHSMLSVDLAGPELKYAHPFNLSTPQFENADWNTSGSGTIPYFWKQVVSTT